MKTKIAAILIAITTFAQADLIDLTPGGFSYQNIPPVVNQFFQDYQRGLENLAGANIIDGQVVWSPFTPFGDVNFDLNPVGPANASTGWDLTGTGSYMNFVLVESQGFLANLYGVTGDQRFIGFGDITIDGITNISAVTFAGDMPVPDTGSTLILMYIGLSALAFTFRRFPCL